MPKKNASAVGGIFLPVRPGTRDQGRPRARGSAGQGGGGEAGGGRTRALSRARESIAYLWTAVLGRPGRPLAPALGVRPQAMSAAAARGRTARDRWDRLAEKLL